MNDQSPFKTGIRYEGRTEITYLDEPIWRALVHKLIHAIDRNMDKTCGASEARELKRQQARELNARLKAEKEAGLAAAKKAREERRREIEAYAVANPSESARSISRRFNVGLTFANKSRRRMGLAPLTSGRNLKSRYADLIAKRRELSDEQVAEILGTKTDYVRKLRRMFKRAQRANGAAKTASAISVAKNRFTGSSDDL